MVCCCCCVVSTLSSSHTGLLRPLLLLVFNNAKAFNQDLSSWNVGKVTTMYASESSVRSLLLFLLFLSPPLSSPSLS